MRMVARSRWSIYPIRSHSHRGTPRRRARWAERSRSRIRFWPRWCCLWPRSSLPLGSRSVCITSGMWWAVRCWAYSAPSAPRLSYFTNLWVMCPAAVCTADRPGAQVAEAWMARLSAWGVVSGGPLRNRDISDSSRLCRRLTFSSGAVNNHPSLEEPSVHARRSFLAVATFAVSATALAAQNAPQAPPVTVGGVVYTQYQYTDAPVHTNTFDVTRAYVNVLGRFANGITTRLTTDIIPSAVTNQVIRLKYAYVAWTPTGSSLTYKLGMIQTPYVDFEETLWDYRMQGPIAVDRNGYLTSADIGFGVDGRWNNDQVNGQIAIVNGEGYSGGTGDFRKDLEARLSVRLQPTNDVTRVGGLRVTGYAGIGKATGTGNDRNRYLGLLSYKTQQHTLAGEFVSTKT